MGKCLKTQLNEVVNNDSLNLLGYVKLTVNSSVAVELSDADRKFMVKSKGGNITVKNVGGHFNNESGVNIGDTITITNTADTVIWYSSDTKYMHVEAENLKDLKSFYSASVYGLIVDLDTIKYYTDLRMLTLSGTGQTGKVSDLKNLINLETLDFTVTSIVGDISELKNCTKIGYLVLGASSGLTGDIASWATNRQAGTMTLAAAGNSDQQKVTCNGVRITQGTHTVTFDGLGGCTIE